MYNSKTVKFFLLPAKSCFCQVKRHKCCKTSLSTRNAFKKSCGKNHLLAQKACLYYIASGKLIHPTEEFAVKTVQIDRRQPIIVLSASKLSLQHATCC